MSAPRIQKAPDGKPWPRPRVLVSRREQRPYAFGWKPLLQPEEGARIPIHLHEALPHSLVVRELGGPYHVDWTPTDAPLLTADYTLSHPQNGTAMEALVLVEAKRNDLAASLTHGHDALMAEMERMRVAKHRYLVAAASGDDLMEGRCGCASRVKAMVHCLESIAMRCGVQVRQYASQSRAEYVIALVLQRAWREHLTECAESLACERAREARAA